MPPHTYDPGADETTGEIAAAAELRQALDRSSPDEALDEALGHLERDRHRRPPPDLGGAIPSLGPDPADAPDADPADADGIGERAP